MFRYSYKVELKRHEAKRLGLLLDLEINPQNEKALKLLKVTEQQIDWLKERIQNGKDPGYYNL